jgi:hypothetical protein
MDMKNTEHFLKQVLAAVAEAKQAVDSLSELDPDLVVQVDLPEFRSLDRPRPGRAVPLAFFSGRV